MRDSIQRYLLVSDGCALFLLKYLKTEFLLGSLELSESTGLEVEASVFIDAKQEVHVLHGLFAGSGIAWLSRQATPIPTPICNTYYLIGSYYMPMGVIVALFLTTVRELPDSQTSRTKRQVTPFYI